MTNLTMLELVERASEKSHLYPVEGGTYLRRWPQLGIGYLDAHETVPYDEEYWLKYQSYRGNGIGEQLTTGRIEMTSKEWRAISQEQTGVVKPEVIDIGIGSGEFVEEMNCYGTDVNPHAIAWLKKQKCYRDPLANPAPILTFWDVLEHIQDPKPLLDTAKVVLTSLPIHADVQGCLESKHLRPGEHLWHFTDQGIREFMTLANFQFIASDDFEIRAGREGIITYIFHR